MNNLFKKLSILPFIFLLHSCNPPVANNNVTVLIKTTLGDIKILLYDGTPLHRDNFLNLIKIGAYDNVIFHRVIKDFMIQTGDISTRSPRSKSLPDSLNVFTIPAEFKPEYFHKKGALAAAREGNEENPDMRSSGTQFYIVQGVKYSETDLDKAEQNINGNIRQSVFNKLIRHTTDSLRLAGKSATEAEIQEIASLQMFNFLSSNTNYKIPEDQRNVYKSIGGVPRLDGTYTVFGEVTEGLDIVDRIAACATDSNDKPLTDIRILSVRILKN